MDASLDENDPSNWGTKVEIKNVNSFGGIRNAINYEIDRQTDLIENGEKVVQQTRRWDEESQTTIAMREKVDAIDYNYFVEPNIPKYKLSPEWIEEIRASIPELALDRKKKYMEEYGLSAYDAGVLTQIKDISDYYDKCVEIGIDKKQAANWVSVNIIAELNKDDSSIKDFYITPIYLKQIIDSINNNTISSKQAKEIFNKSIVDKKEPKEYLKENAQISDESYLRDLINKIVENNLEQKQAYLNGRTNLFDYFVGQVMKETKGKANPNMTKEILNEVLNK